MRIEVQPRLAQKRQARITRHESGNRAPAASTQFGIGSASADREGGQTANTPFTEIPSFLAQAPAQHAPDVATAQNGRVVQTYVTQSSHGTIDQRDDVARHVAPSAMLVLVRHLNRRRAPSKILWRARALEHLADVASIFGFAHGRASGPSSGARNGTHIATA